VENIIPYLPTSHSLRVLKIHGISFLQNPYKILDILHGLSLLEELELTFNLITDPPFRGDWHSYPTTPVAVVHLPHLIKATIRKTAVMDVSTFWSRIEAPSGAELYFIQCDSLFMDILDVIQPQVHHPEHNAIQIRLDRDTPWLSLFHYVIRIYRAEDDYTILHPGIVLAVEYSNALPVLEDLPSKVILDSIHHLDLEIGTASMGTRLHNMYHQFTSVTSLMLRSRRSVNLNDFLGLHGTLVDVLTAPNLRCLKFQLLQCDMISDSNSYTAWWNKFNDILAIRTRLGKPVQQLFLMGRWVVVIDAGIADVDKIAVARTRSLVGELIDERTFFIARRNENLFYNVLPDAVWM